MWRNILVLGCCLTLTTAVLAGERTQQPEKIPAPKIAQPVPPIVFESYTPRMGSIDVWQHYGVNRLGRFVPRVIVLPEGGAYYSRDLQPFPWASHRSSATMPYAVD
jgi:hypothetical protein